ncbi:MAG: hypothetical protein QM669_09625, partial [Siphonobacter sp.]
GVAFLWASLASCTNSNGLLIWPVGLIVILWKEAGWKALVWSVVMISINIAYFSGSWHREHTEAISLVKLANAGLFFVTMNGSWLYWETGKLGKLTALLAGVSIWLAGFIWLKNHTQTIRKILRSKEIDTDTLFWIQLMAWVLLSSAAMAWGRSGSVFNAWAISDWLRIQGVLLLIVVYALIVKYVFHKVVFMKWVGGISMLIYLLGLVVNLPFIQNQYRFLMADAGNFTRTGHWVFENNYQQDQHNPDAVSAEGRLALQRNIITLPGTKWPLGDQSVKQKWVVLQWIYRSPISTRVFVKDKQVEKKVEEAKEAWLVFQDDKIILPLERSGLKGFIPASWVATSYLMGINKNLRQKKAWIAWIEK